MMKLTNESWTKLSQGKVEEIARQLETSVAKVMAVVTVEARGRGFLDSRIQALFERHKFHAELTKRGDKVKLAKAMTLGLASKKPGGYPKTLAGVHAQIRRAMAIDEDAALRATSWGLGQIMGFNCKLVGYESARAMVEAFLTGEDAQIQAMARFIEANHLDDELRRGDWKGFARGYNGEDYERNDYDGKLAAAHKRLSAIHPEGAEPAPAEGVLLSMGDKGELVAELQRLLNAKGFSVGRVDRDYGAKTKKAVRLFQLDRGLPGTGIVDSATWDAIKAAPDEVQPEARAEATAKDLKGESSIVKNGLAIRNGAGCVAVALGSAEAVQETGLLEEADRLTEGLGKVKEVVEAAKPILAFVADNWQLVAAVALVGMAYAAARIVRARVEDHRTGRTA